MSNQLPRDDNDVAIQGVAQRGPVAASGSNAAVTTGGSDYTFAWANNQVVNHVWLQNNTASPLNFEWDAPATAGSSVLAAGQSLSFDIQTAALHLLTAANQNVNGAVANGIVVRGWL